MNKIGKFISKQLIQQIQERTLQQQQLQQQQQQQQLQTQKKLWKNSEKPKKVNAGSTYVKPWNCAGLNLEKVIYQIKKWKK